MVIWLKLLGTINPLYVDIDLLFSTTSLLVAMPTLWLLYYNFWHHLLFCVSPAVRELVVSAGESVEVTLPRNEVELNAFVVPTPPQGKTMETDKI